MKRIERTKFETGHRVLSPALRADTKQQLDEAVTQHNTLLHERAWTSPAEQMATVEHLVLSGNQSDAHLNAAHQPVPPVYANRPSKGGVKGDQ